MKRLLLFVASLWLGIMGASAQEDRCDVNGDGEVDITDVTYVIDHILGKGHASVFTGEAIDLGLPSGTKWASCNVGATKPEEYGGYYALGETEEKEFYDVDTYKYYQNNSFVMIGSDISGTEYDVAHVKWGGNWCMPTWGDIQELLDNCTAEWTTLNGIKGVKYTSKINGNSIFLPAAGYRWDDVIDYADVNGYYWSSIQIDESYYSYYLNLSSGDGGNSWEGYLPWYYGQSVRPVFKP